MTHPAAPTLREIQATYKSLGYANSPEFVRPEGQWVRVFTSGTGSTEIWADHNLRQFYRVDMS